MLQMDPTTLFVCICRAYANNRFAVNMHRLISGAQNVDTEQIGTSERGGLPARR
jgi:hypothetical protein